ncbi:MAG: polysaccharide deacetylase family protein [Bacteroidetes bacterium]|nr:polysaccharide deacetylase family protein [Bacteroidota bacterium]
MRKFVIVRDVCSVLAVLGVLLAGSGIISWWWLLVLLLVFSTILALGAIKIGWNFYITSHHRGDGSQKRIALSFDDGPAAHSETILDILRSEQVPATFFCIGKCVERTPEIARRYDAEGHLVGNHTYHHQGGFYFKNRKSMHAELQQTNDLISETIGKRPKLFRPPYGVTNPVLSKALDLCNMHSIGWSLRSFDTISKSPEALLRKLLAQTKNGDIILLHDSIANTAAVLTSYIQSCKQRGFTFVRLDELLNVKPYE